MPLILSVITVNLNNLAGLEKTALSVIKQDFNNFEFIILDGNSWDGSKKFIESISSHLAYWVSEPDRGIYHAMNKGINQAKGEYCLFLNSGDWLVDDDVLSSTFATSRQADILLGDCRVSELGKPVYIAKPAEKLTLKSFVRNTIPHQSTFIRRTLFDTYGLYNEQYVIYADYDYWLRTIILGQCTTERLGLTVADYNMDGLSSDAGNKPNLHAEATAILEKYFPKTVLNDYYSWLEENNTSRVILDWAKSHKLLYTGIELLYKVDKNIKRIRHE